MSVAKILVPLRGGSHDDGALSAAFALAKPFNAHVRALCIPPDPREILYHVHGMTAPSILEQLVTAAGQEVETIEKNSHESLLAAAKVAGARVLAAPEYGEGTTCSFQEEEGFFGITVARHARFSDIVCLGELSPLQGSALADAFNQTLIGTRKPVLLCPSKHRHAIGQHVAIGWNGSTTAAHAISASLDILKQAKIVELLVVKEPGNTAAGTAELRDYLACHGVFPTQYEIESTENPGAQLLETATQHQCDLLVVGGYGHSRIGEAIFGGATKYFVSHPVLPVLITH